MTPPQLQISFDVLLSAGMLPISTFGEPGTHGDAVAGTHGIGVRTPSAAAVAAATVGFASELHTPNGMMLSSGTLSMIVAAGVPVSTLLAGSTTKLLGAAPKLHCNVAPKQTWMAITPPRRSRRPTFFA